MSTISEYYQAPPEKKWALKRPMIQAMLVETKDKIDPGDAQLICDMRDILDEVFNPEIIANAQL